MNQADLIWMNGEFVAVRGRQGPRTHARAALRDRRLRGRPRLRDPARDRDLPPPGPHRPAVPLGRHVLHGHPVQPRRRSARRRTRRSRATASSPATSARSCSAAPGRWACTRSTARSTCSIAVWEWGAYLGEEGKQNGVRAKVSSWRRIAARRRDPRRQGDRPVPQLGARQDRGRQGRLRGGDPARQPRLSSARAPARTCSSSRTA